MLHGALHCDGTITVKSILENKVRGSGMELFGTGCGPSVGANECGNESWGCFKCRKYLG